MELKFKLSLFEGPLDLLIHLIRKNEIDIQNIPIAEITGQYLQYLELMKELDLEVAGEFIALAATLLRIKSKLLLPKPPAEQEDETGEDPRQELITMIMEYQRYKDAADFLDVRRSARDLLYERGDFGTEKEFENTEELLVVDLLDLMKTFSELVRKSEHRLLIQRDEVRVEDRIVFLRTLMREKNQVGFYELFSAAASKRMLVATFMALLELIRMGEIVAVQDKNFEQIQIVRREPIADAAPTGSDPASSATT